MNEQTETIDTRSKEEVFCDIFFKLGMIQGELTAALRDIRSTNTEIRESIDATHKLFEDQTP